MTWKHNSHHTEYAWLAVIKARGWGDTFGTVLDALEPLGPLGAQFLWVAQPALGVFIRRDTVDELARILETPDGIAWLRAQLENETLPEDDA
ncbi:MAG: hypothetical protein D6737_09535 [Chloroflexi bacterium]|nr:MAG: hypothetical protein D6737_09535 [Chloroflexota bacterium]